MYPVGMDGADAYQDISEVLAGSQDGKADANEELFCEALREQQSGSRVFHGGTRNYVYTYVPLDNVSDWYLISIIPEDAIAEVTDAIILDSQKTFVLLLVLLCICAVFVLMIWRTTRLIREKDDAIAYQEQLFDIFPPISRTIPMMFTW